jgi:hypothetical protein
MNTFEKRKATRTYKLLQYMKNAGETGLRANEIKKYLFEQINPGKTFDSVANRGTWSTNLYGSYQGIFAKYCEKRNGRWVMVKPLPNDMRAPLFHSPDSQYNWGSSHYHTKDLGDNLFENPEYIK